ncbi:AAA family ATPase [Pseudomonadota bacterium]
MSDIKGQLIIMQTILVLNPKGGSGKSTISTNLAGFLACWGVQVTIADFDPQESSLDWLSVRTENFPKITGIKGNHPGSAIPPQTDYLILDVPSGQYDDAILPWLNQANHIIVPVLPSSHDIRAAKRFLDWMATEERTEHLTSRVAVVANRVRRNTRSYKLLRSFFDSIAYPCIGVLRDTQHYVLAAQLGLTIFEMPSKKVAQDANQWEQMIRWLCLDPYLYPGILPLD